MTNSEDTSDTTQLRSHKAKHGGIQEWELVSDQSIADCYLATTQTGKRILDLGSRGFDKHGLAKQLNLKSTWVNRFFRDPLFRDSYFSLVEQSESLSFPAMVRTLAERESIQFFEELRSLAYLEPQNSQDKTIKLNALKESLTIAGVFRTNETSQINIQELLVMLARNQGDNSLGFGGIPPIEVAGNDGSQR